MAGELITTLAWAATAGTAAAATESSASVPRAAFAMVVMIWLSLESSVAAARRRYRNSTWGELLLFRSRKGPCEHGCSTAKKKRKARPRLGRF